MLSLERSSRTRFQAGECPCLHYLRLRLEHHCMLRRLIPLGDHIGKFLHRTFPLLCIWPHAAHTKKHMSFTTTLLASQSFPTSAIVMLRRPTMRTRLCYIHMILVTALIVIFSSTPAINFSNMIRCGRHTHSSSISIQIDIRVTRFRLRSASTAFHMDRSHCTGWFRRNLIGSESRSLAELTLSRRRFCLTSLHTFIHPQSFFHSICVIQT